MKNIIATFALLLLPCAMVAAQEEAPPVEQVDPLPCPFALKWGQDPEQVVEWARTNQLTMKWIESPGDPSTVLEIDKGGATTMPNAEFNRLQFRFVGGHLVEAAIIYHRDGTPAQNKAQAEKLEKEIQVKWGKGQESAETAGGSDSSVTTTWKVSEGRFILFNETKSQAASGESQLWVGKVIYRHHALALLAAQKE